jgi:diketogulonate reductase-like aldo/keto reductase
MDRSFWTLTGSPHLLAHSATTGLAAEYKCTPEQVLFRIAQMHGVTPLCGTTNEAHMREAVAAEHVDIVGTSEHTATLQRILTGAQRLR